MINTFNPDNATKSASNPLAYGLTMFAAAVAVLGSSIVSVAQGWSVAKSVEGIGRNPDLLLLKPVQYIVLLSLYY